MAVDGLEILNLFFFFKLEALHFHFDVDPRNYAANLV